MDLLNQIWGEGQNLVVEVTVTALVCLLVLIVRRMDVKAKITETVKDSWLNIKYVVFDVVMVVPAIILMYQFLYQFLPSSIAAHSWVAQLYEMSPLLAIVLCVALLDFIDYWRHRISHMRWLWPIHAIHHSDRALTFLTTRRQHPLNRLFSALCSGPILIMLGTPAAPLAAAYTFRTFYTYFVHSDTAISYGRLLNHVFISPLHHRWHHHLDPKKANSNFAGVFAFYDWVFGSLHLPEEKVIPFGYDHPDYPKYSYFGQLVYPLIAWYKMIKRRIQKRFSSVEHS